MPIEYILYIMKHRHHHHGTADNGGWIVLIGIIAVGIAVFAAQGSDIVPQYTHEENEVPDTIEVFVQVERDVVYDTVEVQFRGGKGHGVLRAIDFYIERSDGIDDHARMTNPRVGQCVELKGSKHGNDHVIVVAEYMSNQRVKIVEKYI